MRRCFQCRERLSATEGYSMFRCIDTPRGRDALNDDGWGYWCSWNCFVRWVAASCAPLASLAREASAAEEG